MRYEDWTVRLQKYMDANTNIHFRYSEHDCCIFASGAVKAITGIDLLIDLDYAQEIGSYRRCRNLNERVSKVLSESKFEGISPTQASRGDIVLCKYGKKQREIVGICIGARIILPGELGLISFPLSMGYKAWKVC